MKNESGRTRKESLKGEEWDEEGLRKNRGILLLDVSNVNILFL